MPRYSSWPPGVTFVDEQPSVPVGGPTETPERRRQGGPIKPDRICRADVCGKSTLRSADPRWLGEDDQMSLSHSYIRRIVLGDMPR